MFLERLPFLWFHLFWSSSNGVTNAAKSRLSRTTLDGHHFWRPPDQDQAAVVQPSVYKTKFITNVGEALLSKRECWARLSNGLLCPRRDLKNCPNHGKIVDPAEEKCPVEKTSSTPVVTTDFPSRFYEGPFQGQRQLPADFCLVNTAKPVHERRAVRDRMRKKVMDKRAMKRPCATLDAIQKAKIEKKCASQFANAYHA